MPLGQAPLPQDEMLLRCSRLEAVPILGTEDIPTTMLRAALAGLWGLIIELVSVVVGEFLAGRDIPDCDNPDGVAELFGVAVGFTRVVDIACRVLGRTPIQGITLIQAEDRDVACG